MHTGRVDTLRWLPTGGAGLRTLLELIQQARSNLRLEMYIFRAGTPGDRITSALTDAARRGVNVRVRVDAVGSMELPSGYWDALRDAGGSVQPFNPLGSGRFFIRNHRKLCVVDERIALVAGFNVSAEYDGDGVTHGWRDLGMTLEGPSARALADVFDHHHALADRRPRLLARYQRRHEPEVPPDDPGLRILAVSPGRRQSCLLEALYADLASARRVWACSPYFAPPPKLRRLLRRAARRGADVRLVLPGRSDVPLAQLAARHLYAGLHRHGVQIHEYQPQVLHAKLLLVDDIVYTGSSNLDPRSLHLNHELMVRVTDARFRAEAEAIWADLFHHSRRIPAAGWRGSRTWMQKLRERWSFFLLYRLDPWLTRGVSS